MARLFTFLGLPYVLVALVMLVLARQMPRVAVFPILGAVFGLLGVSFLVTAFAIQRRSVQRAKDRQAILSQGVETTGVITYLDRNFQIRLSGRFPYSIVEYRFTAADGREQTVTDRQVSSEYVIRQDWKIGATIPVRYLSTSPKQSAIVIQEL